MQVRELRTMSINVPWLEVLKACYPNAQVINGHGDNHHGGEDYDGDDGGDQS